MKYFTSTVTSPVTFPFFHRGRGTKLKSKYYFLSQVYILFSLDYMCVYFCQGLIYLVNQSKHMLYYIICCGNIKRSIYYMPCFVVIQKQTLFSLFLYFYFYSHRPFYIFFRLSYGLPFEWQRVFDMAWHSMLLTIYLPSHIIFVIITTDVDVAFALDL